MARSPHAYVRGATADFYNWLLASPVAAQIPEGPPVWICGDCHLGNLGALGDGAGTIDVQVRDLDQAVIGNPAHDLIRLGLSLATAARDSVLPGLATLNIVEAMAAGYMEAFEEGQAHADVDLPQVVRSVRRRAHKRKWKHLARDRLDGAKPKIPLGRKFWPIDEEERAGLTELFDQPDVCRMILSLDGKQAHRRVELVDAAYWMKGCSSLGLRRYAAIVALNGTKARKGYALVDIKEATVPVAPSCHAAGMPSDPAQRVAQAARALSPNLGERLAPATLAGRSVFVRELAPQDLKIEIEQFSRAEAVRAARYLAFVVGRAHARQMCGNTRSAWLNMLRADSGGDDTAPSWLWAAVVFSAGQHESGYLDHCRRAALTQR